jgi:single-strand DNA-binding protein
MNGVNNVILVGVLGRDPEHKSFANGGSVTNLSVATSERWKDKATGERKEKTEWHKVSVFNENLHKVCQYLKKGSKVYIEGQIETRKYTDSQGMEKYTTEIVLKQYRGELQILDGAKSSDNAPEQSPHDVAKTNGYQPEANALDDEVPF